VVCIIIARAGGGRNDGDDDDDDYDEDIQRQCLHQGRYIHSVNYRPKELYKLSFCLRELKNFH